MNHLKDMTSDICTGCTACKAVCPKNALILIKDDEGFQIPRIDSSKCIDCGRCISVCQAYTNFEKKEYENIAYAVRFKNDEVRKNSASGAYFQAIAIFGYFMSSCRVKKIFACLPDQHERSFVYRFFLSRSSITIDLG